MSEQWDTDRVWTVPNMLSFLRLLAIPFFVWLIIAGHDGWAVALLMVSGVTDWFDGWLARRLRQRTKLGAQLDPVTDRLYIIATILALLARGMVPWWFVVLLLARDVLLVALVPFLRRTGRNALPVTFIGKSGTMALLMALPLILAGHRSAFDLPLVWWTGWVLGVIGALLYWIAGAQYVSATHRLLHSTTPKVTSP